MSDHPLSLDCDRDGPCTHWQHRLAAAAARPVSWYLLQLAFHDDPRYAIDRHPILLNEGTRWEEPFGITRALEWANRLAS